MKIYTNVNFKKRNYECTNIVRAVTNGTKPPKINGIEWILDTSEYPNLVHLYTVDDAEIWGYL